MEKGVFLEADVDEHGFQPMLDIFDFAFEDAADDVPIGVAFDVIFFEHAVLEKGDALVRVFRS